MVKMLGGRRALLAWVAVLIGVGVALMPSTAASASVSPSPVAASQVSVTEAATNLVMPEVNKASGWSVTQAPLESLALRGPAWERVEPVIAVPHQMGPVSMRSLSQCGGYTFCIWDYVNYTGGFYNWNTAWNGQCVPIGAPFTDQAESAYNNMPGWTMRLYVDSGCGGGTITSLSYGMSANTFNGNNNKASTVKTV